MDPFAALAALGPFFELTPLSPSPPAGWVSLDESLAEESMVADRVRDIADRLGLDSGDTESLRIAGSVAQLGMTTRVVSPLLALQVMARTCDRLWWQPEASSVFALGAASLPRGSSAAVEWCERISSAHSAICPSERVRTGNVVSAVAGAAAALARHAPTLRDRVAHEAAAVIETVGGTALHTGRPADPGFRRRTCCLLYRSGAALCPDCVLGSSSRNN